MIEIIANSKWYSTEGSVFVVDEVKTIDNESWVFYRRYGSDRQYNCLKEAFLQRFSLTLGSQY